MASNPRTPSEYTTPQKGDVTEAYRFLEKFYSRKAVLARKKALPAKFLAEIDRLWPFAANRVKSAKKAKKGGEKKKREIV